jgi:lipoate---protein ligase
LNIRIIHTGKVSSWRSQSIYHALACTRTATTPDTIVLTTPAEPYVSIGFHRSLQDEIDHAYCQTAGLPVIRRETGGGPVYLDSNQLFVQWIFNPDTLPRKVDQRFRLFCRTLIETYRFFDIKADLSLPNDIHAGNRKITGTGAGAIGESEVLTGNFLFDFDVDAMIRVLKFPDEAFRNMTREGMLKYMTHFRRELKNMPEQDTVAEVYRRVCREVLDRPLEPGEFTPEELEAMAETEAKFATDEWLQDPRPAPKSNRLVKIHAGVWVGETRYRTASGKEIQTLIRTKNGAIDDISFRGDITFQPDGKRNSLAKALKGVDLQPGNVREMLEAFFELHDIRSPDVTIAEWTAAILQIKQNKAMT